MADVTVVFSGWNSSSQAWGSSTWGNDVAFPISSTGTVGTVSIEGAASVPETGLAASGAVGSVAVNEGTGVTVNVTGLASSGAVSSPTIEGNSSVTAGGLAGTGGIGQITATTSQIIPVAPTGISSTAVVNAATIVCECDANVNVSGVQASGLVSRVTVWGRIVPDTNPNIWTEIAA
tara:strand:+ start:424 stop:954 length:531 start_codon:yes stop_codon:yes gene_type:complete